MIKTLHEILLKCSDPKNKTGITFVEVVIVAFLAPQIIRQVKNYLNYIEKNIGH